MSLSDESIDTFIAQLRSAEIKQAFLQQRYDALVAMHKEMVEQKHVLQTELYARISKLLAVCKTIETEDMHVVTQQLEKMRKIIEYPHSLSEE